MNDIMPKNPLPTLIRMPRFVDPQLELVRAHYLARIVRPHQTDTYLLKTRNGVIAHLLNVAIIVDDEDEPVIAAIATELLVTRVIDQRDDTLLLDKLNTHLSGLHVGDYHWRARSIMSEIADELHTVLDPVLPETVLFDTRGARITSITRVTSNTH